MIEKYFKRLYYCRIYSVLHLVWVLMVRLVHGVIGSLTWLVQVYAARISCSDKRNFVSKPCMAKH